MRILSFLAALSLITSPSLTFAADANEQLAQGTAIQFSNPSPHQVVTTPTVIQIEFLEPIDPETFAAKLNGRNISDLFAVSQDGANATVHIRDGLRTSPEKSGSLYAPNKVEVEGQLLDVDAKKKFVKGKVHFLVDGRTVEEPTRVVASIGTEGGSVSLPNYGTVVFPPGAFSSVQDVALFVSSDPSTAADFQTSAILFSAGSRAEYELRVNSGPTPPSTDFDVSLKVPPEFNALIPAGSEPTLYVQVVQAGDESSTMDHFEQILSPYLPEEGLINARLPWWVFTNTRTADGTYEAILVIGSAPIRPVIIDDPLTGLPIFIGDRGCNTRRDPQLVLTPHLVLAPPLDGRLDVTDFFGKIRANGKPHLGTDYATRDAASLPITGLEVRAIDDGVIETVAVEQRNDGVPKGWGQFVVIRHDDGSKSLYAHLAMGSVIKGEHARVLKDEVIASSGNSGGSKTGNGTLAPHLHIEFVPNGLTPRLAANNFAKVDVHPCVSRDIYFINFDLSAGLHRYDETKDYTLTPGWAPLGSSTVFNRHVYGISQSQGTAALTLDGTPIATVENFITDVDVNENGVFVANTAHDGGISNAIKIYSHAGTPVGSFAIPDFHSTMVLGASTTRLCAWDAGEPSAAIFDHSGNRLLWLVSTAELRYQRACAATNDRVYVAVQDMGISKVHVFDVNGAFLQSFGDYAGGQIEGLSVNEKRVYISIAGRMIVVPRHVSRDQNGVIVFESYDVNNAIVLSQPGFPGKNHVE